MHPASRYRWREGCGAVSRGSALRLGWRFMERLNWNQATLIAGSVEGSYNDTTNLLNKRFRP